MREEGREGREPWVLNERVRVSHINPNPSLYILFIYLFIYLIIYLDSFSCEVKLKDSPSCAHSFKKKSF